MHFSLQFSRSLKAASSVGDTKDGDGQVQVVPSEGEWAAVLDFVDNLGTVKQTSILDEVSINFCFLARILLVQNAFYI